jgi:DNA end-binding protein Ku
LRKLVKRKAAGKTIERPEPREDRSNVIDLMTALRQSIKGSRSAPRAKMRTRKSGKRATQARKRAS